MFKNLIITILTKLFPFRTSRQHLSLPHTWPEIKRMEWEREFCGNDLYGKKVKL